MAEILLSLTIIGVVAAITLPSLTGNINERTWNTQRKALYARFSQAVSLMPALNGYGTLDATTDNAAETFVTAGLAKVLKINNICDNVHLKECGIPSKITTMSASTLELESINTLAKLNETFSKDFVDNSYALPWVGMDSKAAAFETSNGESVLVYYNPNCRNDTNMVGWHQTQPYMCANFVYDLNGTKGPNTVGKDIGIMTALYPTSSVVVAPNPLSSDSSTDATQDTAPSICKNADSETRLPNIDEVTAMFYNMKLLSLGRDREYYSTTLRVDTGNFTRAWLQNTTHGRRGPDDGGFVRNVRCIKR